MSNPYCVITSINPPTEAIRELVKRFPVGNVVTVGDTKTDKTKWEGLSFLGADNRAALNLKSAKLGLRNHYAVKNLGYLYAIHRGATLIYDTDDDNIPNDAWKMRDVRCIASVETSSTNWANVYGFFNCSGMWPRGFALNRITDADTGFFYDDPNGGSVECHAPIQQGLADGAPDVDAIWRLTRRDSVDEFTRRLSVGLERDTWCPFNSQTTWWWPEAYALMYLPWHATFRMTDIWRSFVAQRCLWEMGHRIVFHSPSEVLQKRNPHDLIRDFADEVPGYLNNHKIVECLRKETLSPGTGAVVYQNMIACYRALIREGFLPADEIDPLLVWLGDIHEILTRNSNANSS